MTAVAIVRVSIDQVLPVRHALLRSHQPLSKAQFPGRDIA